MNLLGNLGQAVPEQVDESPLSIKQKIAEKQQRADALSHSLNQANGPSSTYILNGQPDPSKYNSDRLELDQIRADILSLNQKYAHSFQASQSWNSWLVQEAERFVGENIRFVRKDLREAVIGFYKADIQLLINQQYAFNPANQNLNTITSTVSALFDKAIGSAHRQSNVSRELPSGNNGSDAPIEHEEELDEITKAQNDLISGYLNKNKPMTLAEKQRLANGGAK